ncbi:MAG TPA: signal peptidase I [Polyangiaceae bacterium]|nr:signal peptidase I [Polyangiaceae bacterium]
MTEPVQPTERRIEAASAEPASASPPANPGPPAVSKPLRYLFWFVWFVLVPLVLATIAVNLLQAAEAAAPPDNPFGQLRWLIQDQPVPAGIVLFTGFEMMLYRIRHYLPLADRVGIGGRSDVPREIRGEYEHAAQLLDEAERILHKNAKAIERGVPSSARQELTASLSALRASMQRERFEIEEFERALERASRGVSRHLGRWRKSEFREYAESIGIAVGVALLLRAFVVEAFKIPSGSMLPTLQLQDHIFVNKFAYGPTIPFTKARLWHNLPPEPGDVMVFEFPDPNPNNERQDYIKRVIALPGDTLEVQNGHPIINGWKVPNCRVGDYQYWEGDTQHKKSGELFIEFLGDESYLVLFEKDGYEAHQGPYTVKPGEVWVLGDNRDNSSDSRAWNGGRGGGVPFENMKGRAMFVWLSFGPNGNVTWDRLLTNVMGKPTLPGDAPAELVRRIDQCLSERPPVEQTTPPAGSSTNLDTLSAR